jgi:hypothetical protein
MIAARDNMFNEWFDQWSVLLIRRRDYCENGAPAGAWKELERDFIRHGTPYSAAVCRAMAARQAPQGKKQGATAPQGAGVPESASDTRKDENGPKTD